MLRNFFKQEISGWDLRIFRYHSCLYQIVFVHVLVIYDWNHLTIRVWAQSANGLIKLAHTIEQVTIYVKASEQGQLMNDSAHIFHGEVCDLVLSHRKMCPAPWHSWLQEQALRVTGRVRWVKPIATLPILQLLIYNGNSIFLNIVVVKVDVSELGLKALQ